MRKELKRVSDFIHLKKDRTCSRFSIPKRLWQGRRRKDNVFSDEELIFRRFKGNINADDWRSTAGLSTAVFDVKNDSTNRSKYSTDPADVLYPITRRNPIHHYQSYGIVAFSVADFRTLSIVPKEPLTTIEGVPRVFTFQLEHIPECCMYPHTEIWIIENGTHVPAPSSRLVKAAVRDELFRISNLVRFPLPL